MTSPVTRPSRNRNGEAPLRCFVALPLPAAVVSHLQEHLEPARGAIDADDRSVRFTDPVRWHVTLAFPGNVRSWRMERLGAELASAVAQLPPPPQVQLAGSGRFGANAAWVGIREVNQADSGWLARAADAVRQACRRAGATPDLTRWRGHMTVARRHRGTPAEVRDALARVAAALADYEGPLWRPGQIVLYESRLGPRPVHTPVVSCEVPSNP